MRLVIWLGIVIFIAVLAAKGSGYRGVYIALALVGFLGFCLFGLLFCVGASAPPPDPRETSATAADMREAASWMGLFAIYFLALTFGGLFGAALYRKQEPPQGIGIERKT